jgi:uncharacterized protein (DUF4415 family)
MTGKNANTRPISRKLGSDLAKVDGHVIQPEEYEELPELTDEDMARAVFSKGAEVLPNPIRARGRPRKPDARVQLSVRLSPDIIERFRATGPGWQTKIDRALREWLETNRPRSERDCATEK